MYNTPMGGTFNLASGNYPNLYNNSLEAGNYIEANPIILGENAYSTHELVIWPDPAGPNDHCQVRQVQGGPAALPPFLWNPEGIFFDLVNNNLVQPQALVPGTAITPTASATPQERDLLASFGKVFYYKIEIGGANPNLFYDTVYISALEIDQSLIGGNFNAIGYADQPFGGDLYFHPIFGEIIVDMPSALTSGSGLNIHLNHTANTANTIYIDTFGIDWFFGTHFNGRIPGLSLYIY